MVDIDDFEKQKECDYKEERYSVRDNGAVMRHPKEGKRPRPSDKTWTFGKPNEKTGYMEICGQRVHRIVAYAFLGNPPADNYVVDHIDTNRRNNRPDNLRWLTRLENALLNPITRARITNICGSIEVFLANPSVLRGHEKLDPNFSWMRQVTKEEARISLQRLTEWANNPSEPTGKGLGDWIFQEQEHKSEGIVQNKNRTDFQNDSPITEEMQKPLETKSLTPNAVQLNWKNPVEYPCCPQNPTDNPLEEYMSNLKVGSVFNRSDYGEIKVLDFGMPNKESLWVMCAIAIGWKTHAFTKVTFKDGIYYHENMGVYDSGDDPEELFESIKKGESTYR